MRRHGTVLDPFAQRLLLGLAQRYAAALWQMTIWYRRALGTTIRSTIDGLIYAAITAATFAYLWPG